MCLSLHLSWLFSRYLSRSLRSLLGLQLLLLERYLDFPLLLSQVLERDLERDLCLRFLSLLRLRLLFLFFALSNTQTLHLCNASPPQAMAAAKTFPPDTPGTYRWSLPLCLLCLSALGIRASSSFRASAATFTSSSSSIFCKDTKLLPLSAKGLIKSLSQRIDL